MKRLQPLAHLYALTSQRRFFRLTYSNTGPEDEPKLFQGRDGIAFNEVGAALIAHGYEYGTTIHFYPDDERRLAEFPPLRDTDKDLKSVYILHPGAFHWGNNATHRVGHLDP